MGKRTHVHQFWGKILLSLYIVLFYTYVPSFAQMRVENLDRGLIAVRVGQNYYLSWRLLATESYTTGFNVYRGTTKLNTSPVTGATIYTDNGAALNSAYTVRAVVNATEQTASEAALIINNMEGNNAGYFDIPLQRPSAGTQGGTYSPGDASTGDLDGDGDYEIVFKWDPSNAKDNSQSGYTDNVYIDAYTLSGTRLWRIDLGINIRAGAHYTQFQVFDYDGDGKAEVMMKTAPGTRDGTGALISMGPAANANHNTDYRNSGGYILEGPEYLTVFDGVTGEELATADYWPVRGTVNDWGDNYGNRVDRFNAATGYVDGERPSALFGRGYYTRLTWAAWDWRDGILTRRWTFDSNSNTSYRGQGNHQVAVVDVDNDGDHDIVTGSAVISNTGTGMHRSGFGHGDALHVTHMIKGTSTPQIYMPHESGGHGVSFRQANNGTMVFNHELDGDIGRGCAAELDPAVPGFKFWGSSGLGLYNTSGATVGSVPNSINHVIWWDGQLSRELLNSNQINKWSVSNNSSTRLLTANDCSSINGTKSNPILQADLFGDWREEVIFSRGSSALRVFTTTMTTTHRLVTLMHDPVYRVAVAWQNSSYNQPPHPGYYIASDMNFPPPILDVVVLGDNTPPVTQYSLTTSVASGQGSVTPASGNHDEGAIVTVTATPVTGWLFDSWGGDLSGSTNPESITMSGNKTVTATFVEDSRAFYTISTTAVGGLITQDPEGASLVEGTDVTFIAVANGGWEFTGWSGEHTGTSATYTVSSLSSNITLEASFLPVDPNLYEAEYAVMYNTVVEDINTGFSGSGYVNFDNESGSYIEIPVYVAEGGEKNITITFANGATNARVVSVAVNQAEVINLLSFDATGSWTTWDTQNITITLEEGINIIKMTSVSADGGPNIDKLGIDIVVPVIYAGRRVARGIIYNSAKFFIQAYKPGAAVRVEMYSINGKRVFVRNVKLGSGAAVIGLPVYRLKDGNYLLKTTIDGSSEVRRINILR